MKDRKLSILKMLIFAVTAVCFIAFMPLSASAATRVKGVEQTKGDDGSVTIQWKQKPNAYGYDIFISTGNGKYKRLYPKKKCDVTGSEHTKKKITNLTAGSKYYIVVKAVYKKKDGTYKIGPASKRLQVVTAPSKTAKSTIRQIKATPHSIKFKWNKVRGANRYIIYVNDKKRKVVKTNSATVRVKAGTSNTVQVVPVNRSKSGFQAKGGTIEAYDLYSAPRKPKRVAVYRYNNLTWQPTVSNTVTVGWTKSLVNKYDPTGYEVRIYTIYNQRVKTFFTTRTKVSFNVPAFQDRGFRMRVRAYVTINGKRYFGNWTDVATVIPQARATMKRTDKTEVTLNWKPVSNTRYYVVFACNDVKASKRTWRKVATLGPNARSYVYKNCIYGKSTAMFVLPVVYIGGKRYVASYTWHMYMDITD